MKNPTFLIRSRGFTLMETVIAIGVLALLLTAFLAVFGPAAQGIRKSISVQEADRLAYTLEQELVTLRDDSSDYKTGFEKAYDWIIASNTDALLIYQYRGKPGTVRNDGTLEPFLGQGVSGQDFIVQPMVRKRSDAQLREDLKALEGRIYTAKLTQLVYNGGQLRKGTAGTITDPTPGGGDDTGGGSGADGYPEAVIAFAAEFHIVPNSSQDYIQSPNFQTFLTRVNAGAQVLPIFTRNLAVRR